MKQLSQFAIVTSLALSSSAFAVNPVQGFYGGILAEVGAGPSDYVLHFRHDNMDFIGTVKYQPVGGGGGVVLGYRVNKFRVEGELLYNTISYKNLTIGSCVLQSPNTTSPIGYCPQDHFQRDTIGFKGSTTGMYGMFNGFFDFVTYEGENSLVPYIGLGIGGAHIQNKREFVNILTTVSRSHSDSSSSAAAQGILGISYYLDDFTWMGMDYRYLSTNSLDDFNQSRYALNTLNFYVDFSFDS